MFRMITATRLICEYEVRKKRRAEQKKAIKRDRDRERERERERESE